MRRFWFKILLGVLTVTSLGTGVFLSPKQAEAYQEAATPTGIFVTVTYTDPINVRSGPSTLIYPIIAQLFPGDVVPALGISPGRDWVHVSYPGGTGWVYASSTYVSISGGELQVVEPPPTPPPPPTSTIDPTLAAAFSVQPTSTRLPTFTPPPPLASMEVEPGHPAPPGVVPGVWILGLSLLGGLGLLVSYILRK